MGFSQGASIASLTSLISATPTPVGGTVLLSGGILLGMVDLRFLEELMLVLIKQANSNKKESNNNEKKARIFIGTGTDDMNVNVHSMRMLRDLTIQFLGEESVEYREYNIGHRISVEEMNDIVRFINNILP